MGQLNKNNPAMVFDWNRAAQLIRERKAKNASAGLSGDWEWTGGTIFDGKPLSRDRTYTYLASPWATPELAIDGQTIDCLIMQEAAPDWDAKTFWPDSALAILNGPRDA